jgi:hypothetical protein
MAHFDRDRRAALHARRHVVSIILNARCATTMRHL